MAKTRKRVQKRWVYVPPPKPKPKVPEDIKIDLEEKANLLVESYLKPNYIKPEYKSDRYNYIVDIYTKWYRNYFYFISKYHCPGPTAISSSFEAKFTRLEYVGDGLFDVAYMRHTGKWQEVYMELSMNKCLATIKNEATFHP